MEKLPKTQVDTIKYIGDEVFIKPSFNIMS